MTTSSYQFWLTVSDPMMLASLRVGDDLRAAMGTGERGDDSLPVTVLRIEGVRVLVGRATWLQQKWFRVTRWVRHAAWRTRCAWWGARCWLASKIYPE